MYNKYLLYTMGGIYQTVLLYSFYSMVQNDYDKEMYNKKLLKCMYTTDMYKK